MGASLPRTSRCRPAGFSSRSGHTYLVRSGASRFSSDSLRSRHLTRSVALEKSRVTWKRPAVCVASGISPGTPEEKEPDMSRVTSAVAAPSPPWASTWSHMRPTDPLSFPSVTATHLLPSRSSMVDM